MEFTLSHKKDFNMTTEILHISKRFGKKIVLRDVSFSTSPGEGVGILGANGCGKSTLFSILAGVMKPDNGSFTSGSVDLLKNSRERVARVGYVPQGTPLLEELTARDNLLLWYTKDKMNRSLENGVLKMLGIGDFLGVTVSRMSGGMKKRLSIGCAMAESPALLLLDEPTAALDLVCKENISEYLKKHKEAGGTIVIATHDVRELELCDRLFILKNGTLEKFDFDGDVERLVRCLV